MSISRKHNHGTNVNCCEMNQAIVMLNVDLLYYSVLAKEVEQLEDSDIKSGIFCYYIEKYELFIRWDVQGKCLRIQDMLPEKFDAEAGNHTWFLAGKASKRVNATIKRFEDERKANGMKKFLITIDTEGDNLWQWKNGDPIGTDNTKYLPRFQNLCDKYGFKPTWLTNYEMMMDDNYVQFITEVVNEGRGEIGMHLHAWSTPPEYFLKAEKDNAPYLIEYPEHVMEEKICAMTNIIKELTGVTPTSHRAGRWAMNETYFRLLKKYGYLYDCSATPHIDWSGNGGQTKDSKGSDYSKASEKAYRIQEILEIPVTIRKAHRMSVKNAISIKEKLKSVYHFIKGQNLWLRPNGHNLDEMLYLIDRVEKSSDDYIMFMIHSSELMPGGSPTFKSEEDIEKLYHDLEIIFERISKRFEGATVSEYGKSILM